MDHDRPDAERLTGTVALLSTSDTDLLAARPAARPTGWPTRPGWTLDGLPALLDGTDVVVVRLLGGEQAWREGLAALRDQPRPVVVVGGEFLPDAALMTLSTVPAGVAAQAHDYLAHGGTDNLRELARFLTDTVLLGGTGFARAAARRRPGASASRGRRAGRRPAPGRAPAHRGDHLLPGPRAGREHRLRRPAGRGRRRRRGPGRCRSGAPACAPPSPACSTCSAGRRADRHRARGRRRHPGAGPGRAATTKPGTPGPSPRWTCPSCRRCA